MNEVKVKKANGKFEQAITIGKHHVTADETESNGGTDLGANPQELLLASLGACTSMTIQMYAQRKGWPVEQVEVSLSATKGEDAYHITRNISFGDQLDAEQRSKLLEIANKCPVHKILSGTIKIETKAA